LPKYQEKSLFVSKPNACIGLYFEGKSQKLWFQTVLVVHNWYDWYPQVHPEMVNILEEAMGK